MLSRLRRQKPGPESVIATTDLVPLARVPATVRQEMQYLWTRLLVHDGLVPRSIGVTSQVSGEGVSFICHALAVAMAETRRTCIVEANWWGEALPLPEPTAGLAGLLEGSAAIGDVMVETNYPGLSILPAGEFRDVERAAVHGPDAMEAVIAQIHEDHDHVIIDLPALTVSSTALGFAAAAEASLLVARQKSARMDEVERSMADLRETNLLGVVLNDNHVAMPRLLQHALLHS
ncbi:MAG: CpsD/CapB family tyrosine-protein kinase [Acidimicrobiales bacterium]